MDKIKGNLVYFGPISTSLCAKHSLTIISTVDEVNEQVDYRVFEQIFSMACGSYCIFKCMISIIRILGTVLKYDDEQLSQLYTSNIKASYMSLIRQILALYT
jgi:hypothetical protein